MQEAVLKSNLHACWVFKSCVKSVLKSAVIIFHIIKWNLQHIVSLSFHFPDPYHYEMAFLFLSLYFFHLTSWVCWFSSDISDNNSHPFMLPVLILYFLTFLCTLSPFLDLCFTQGVSVLTNLRGIHKLSIYKANMHTSASLGLFKFISFSTNPSRARKSNGGGGEYLRMASVDKLCSYIVHFTCLKKMKHSKDGK